MIVVHIELWPHGDESRKRSLGRATIALTGVTPDCSVGRYDVRLYTWAGATGKTRVWRRGVCAHRRLIHGPWDLLFRALLSLVGARNKDPLTIPAESEPDP